MGMGMSDKCVHLCCWQFPSVQSPMETATSVQVFLMKYTIHGCVTCHDIVLVSVCIIIAIAIHL